jgi:hypothetical protein
MRARVVVSLLLAALIVPSPATAQDAEALRKELEQMRQQFDRVREDYEKAMKAMSERLERLEARPRTAATAPTVVQAPAPPAPAMPTLLELARPREPFSLYGAPRRGQFLLDLGVAGDFVGNLTSDKATDTNSSTFPARENRFFPREIELSFFGQIDPYARGEVRLEAAEEGECEVEDGVVSCTREEHFGLAEAHLTLLALPYATQLKMGFMRNRFGLLNQRHQHDLPQIDRPDVLVRFFGEEGLTESGFEFTWVPPLPFYLETLVGGFNGDNENSFGRGSLQQPLFTGRLRTFFELGPAAAIQLGVSGATGEDEERFRTNIAGADLKFKLTPEGWRHPLLTLAGEFLFSNRKVAETTTVEVDDGMGGLTEEEMTKEKTRNRYGFYVYGEVQPFRRWLGGLRFDWTEDPKNPGHEWAIEPYLAFLPSDFLRFRVAYKHTGRSSRQFFFGPGTDSATTVDELLVQATFILGAHPAHPF